MKEKLQMIKYFILDSVGLIHSLWVYCFRNIAHPGVFYGFHSYYWASKFAEKRFHKWHPEWDQSGRQQGVFPLGEIKLIVCSKMELDIFKKKGIVSKKMNPRKAIKKSYYTTKMA